MRVAFYAPMKPPTHPLPSGDRRMARLFMTAIAQGGHEVELASRLCSHEMTGDRGRQARLAALGERLADRLVARYRSRPARHRPQLWFTYHLYHKAPDWLGPRVAAACDLPYVVAEASVAAKQAGGAWDLGYRSSLAALARARAVITLNSADLPGIRPWLAAPDAAVRLKPFLDIEPFRRATDLARDALRADRATRHRLDPTAPWLLTVAMMRDGDKLESYRLLGRALCRLLDRPWHLVVVGDGPARSRVTDALAPVAERVRYAGEIEQAEIAGWCAASDLMVWPAIREAFGMALLEGQAAGLPVVAGATGGVPEIIADGETGLLPPVGDEAAFAAAVARLLDDPSRRRRFGEAAADKARGEHDLTRAASQLGRILARL
jgi:glycosyltransferase involved in cell wall biosynthesis